MEASVAAVEPLPLVPAIRTAGNLRSGCSRASSRTRMRERSNLCAGVSGQHGEFVDFNIVDRVVAKQLKIGAGVRQTRSLIAALSRRSIVILTLRLVFSLLLAGNTASGDENGAPKPSSKISLEPLGYA